MTDLELARACRDAMYAKDLASQALGIEVTIPEPGSAEARMNITAAMLNGFGICHGGYVFALADTAFAFACNAYDRVTVAAGASIDYLKPVHAGDALRADAREIHRGRRAGLYEVCVRNQDDVLVAVFQGRSSALDKSLLYDLDQG
ncbi:MAG: hydroxyphenylacetyl-CoA thioesterase PaaI [Proteobacteria bacterium]|nr:hydroxyphenylacetyl-CoA thioesterase PaaI [Pseudomonadota bacterium]